MIVYIDSSVLVRYYLPDETGHEAAREIIEDGALARVTGSWSLVEVSGALVRAARSGRGDEGALLSLLDADLGQDGAIVVISAAQAEVEARALKLVREHALRAMDAWHLATAALALPTLLEPGEDSGFASRDQAQLRVARSLGFQLL
ncbi:MAG: type II toxin-antitoxin system VapC family toxin [Candidatus Dormibacteria bacterium]